MKQIEHLLITYARRLMSHPDIIDQKTFHRKKVEVLIRTAFIDGMDYMTRAHNNALSQLNDALQEEVEGSSDNLTDTTESGSIQPSPEGENSIEENTIGNDDQAAGSPGN